MKGSDHCPVYATIKERIQLDGKDTHVLDVMNPPGMFINGNRLREYSVKDILSLSGKMIPEFDRRQSIRDMFKRKPTLLTEKSVDPVVAQEPSQNAMISCNAHLGPAATPAADSNLFSAMRSETLASQPKDLASTSSGGIVNKIDLKRTTSDASTNRSLKRGKLESTSSKQSAVSQEKEQQRLEEFFKPKVAVVSPQAGKSRPNGEASSKSRPPQGSGRDMLVSANSAGETPSHLDSAVSPDFGGDRDFEFTASIVSPSPSLSSARVCGGKQRRQGEDVYEPIESEKPWSKIFTKPVAPRCEGHGEPCISLLTKKSGMNCGRSFWMCPRPLGPSGMKEKGTQWRCQTFIWCSDWNAKDA